MSVFRSKNMLQDNFENHAISPINQQNKNPSVHRHNIQILELLKESLKLEDILKSTTGFRRLFS